MIGDRLTPAEVAERLRCSTRRVRILCATPCIVWMGALNAKGYGCFGLDGDTKLAHRVAYEFENGPIPDGLTIDHLCRVKRCVNPAHLEAVTGRENTRRAVEQDRPNDLGYHHVGGHCFRLQASTRTDTGLDLRTLRSRGLVDRVGERSETRWRYIGPRTNLDYLVLAQLDFDITEDSP